MPKGWFLKKPVPRTVNGIEDDAPILREFRVASSTAPHCLAAPMCAALKHNERIVVTAMGAQCVRHILSTPNPTASHAFSLWYRRVLSLT